MLYIDVTTWANGDDYKNTLGFSLDDTHNVPSELVSLFYVTGYRSFKAITDKAETLNQLWQYYLFEMLPQLQRTYSALMSEYNPIENYNSTETESTTANGTNTSSNIYGSRTDSATTSANNSSVDSVTTFDNTTYNNSGKVEGTSSTTGTNTMGEHTDTVNGTDTNTVSRTLARSGNIGVTTSQQMIESEMVLRSKAHIISDFLRAFAERYFFIDFSTNEYEQVNLDEVVAEIMRRLPKAESEVF